MKYSNLVVMKVIKKSDILVIAMSDSKKMVKALPNNRYTFSCFYHNDKKPSMIVDRNNNRFYCFSCKKGGNVISLFQQVYNLNFLASLETLACTFNVKLPKRSYNEINYEIVEKLNVIKNSYEYKELIQKSYIKTLKK